MTETLFCYCCRVHHPKSQMRLFRTAMGNRWRCIRSIEAATAPRCDRDDFGRRQTEQNREEARGMAEQRQRLQQDFERDTR